MVIFVTAAKIRKVLGFLRIMTYGYDETEWIVTDYRNNIWDTVESDNHNFTTGSSTACTVLKKRVRF
jgi:hypothetical protein